MWNIIRKTHQPVLFYILELNGEKYHSMSIHRPLTASAKGLHIKVTRAMMNGRTVVDKNENKWP
jgi:hypothetical protein